jgi:signal peptidase I
MNFLRGIWLFITRIWYLQLVSVVGDSMHPFLIEGDILIVLQIPPFESSIERGTVVICSPPWVKSKYVIKRIIGLEKDYITIDRNDQVMVFKENQGVNLLNSDNDKPFKKYWQVKENEYFITGDNYEKSTDSRSMGPIDRKYVKGVAIYRIWPLHKAGGVENKI